ncbi:hypothetical protein ACFW2T_00510 [Streptomyces sp. NPDC058892]|uniref:hypothetical protein n=1 Tax=unclassified Streptomyces TaxID=2593676 RepID=UPI0036B816D2
MLKHGLLLRIRLGHPAEPAPLRSTVGELAHTRGEPGAAREATDQAAGIPEGTLPALALRWSERQHLAELEPGEALLADLGGSSTRHGAAARQARGDAPTPG